MTIYFADRISRLNKPHHHGPKRWPRIGWLLCSVNGEGRIKRLWLYAFGFGWHVDWSKGYGLG